MKINTDSEKELNCADSKTLKDWYQSDINRYFRNSYIVWGVYLGFADGEIGFLPDI